MAPEKRQFWQQAAVIISIVAFLVGIGMAWQSVKGEVDVHTEKIEKIEDVQRTQWSKVNGTERKLDEIGINLKILMRNQNLEYQKVDE
jgi:hypothetical protein